MSSCQVCCYFVGVICPIGWNSSCGSFFFLYFFLDQLLFCWCYCQIDCWMVDVIVRSVAVFLCLKFFLWLHALFCFNSFWLISYFFTCRDVLLYDLLLLCLLEFCCWHAVWCVVLLVSLLTDQLLFCILRVVLADQLLKVL